MIRKSPIHHGGAIRRCMRPSWSAAALVCVTGVSLAQAPQTARQSLALEEIVVTASKRGALSIQDIPSNISAVTGEALQRASAVSLEDISRLVPGLYTVQQSPGNQLINVRGLTSTVGAAQVGFYVDEIIASDTAGGARQTDFGLYDIERVEVLRGPQGTLYGAGSQGGTLRYITKKPDLSEFDASLGASIGFRSRGGGEDMQLNGMMNLPVVADRFAVRAVGYRRDVDGIVDMPDLALTDTDDLTTDGGRFLAKLNIGDRTSVLASVFYEATDMDNTQQVMPTRDIRPGRVLNPYENELNMYNLTIEQQFEWGTITATGSDYDRETFRGFDQSNFTIVPTGGRLGRIDQYGDVSLFSGELRFASEFGGPIQTVAGVFYSDGETVQTNFGNFIDPASGGAFEPPQQFLIEELTANVQNKALFANVIYELTDRLSVEGGVRFFRVESDASTFKTLDLIRGGSGTGSDSVAEDEDSVVRAQVTFDVTDDVLTYLTYSEGFRQGGANDQTLVGAIPLTFDPDYVKNYEWGWKSSLLGGQLILNGAVYYMMWDDIQVGTRDLTGTRVFTSNAGEAELRGVELEGQVRPDAVSGLTIGFNFRWSEQHLTEDNPLAVAGPGNPVPNLNAGLEGEDFPNTNNFAGALNVEKSFPLGSLTGYVRTDLSYTGDGLTTFHPTDPAARVLPDYFLAGLRIGVRSERWEASIFGRNLFDEREPVTWFVDLGGVGPNTIPPRLPDRVQTTQPRQIGVAFSYDF